MASSWIILGIGSANGRRRYIVMPSLIDWAHAQNDPGSYPFISLMYDFHKWNDVQYGQFKTSCDQVTEVEM